MDFMNNGQNPTRHCDRVSKCAAKLVEFSPLTSYSMLEHARAVAFAIAGAGTPYSGPFLGAGAGSHGSISSHDSVLSIELK